MNLRTALLPLLLLGLGCRRPEGYRPPPPKTVVVNRTPALGLHLTISPGVEAPEALAQELRAALTLELASWGLQAGTVPHGVPMLRVEIQRHIVRPALNPAYGWVFPGVASTGAGVSIISQGSYASLIGVPILGAGVAFIALGSAFGGRSAYLEKRRGYILHPFKAEVRLEWVLEGEAETFKEIYRQRHLGTETRPLASPTPDGIRQEMVRALAIEIRKDLDSKFEVDEDS